MSQLLRKSLKRESTRSAKQKKRLFAGPRPLFGNSTRPSRRSQVICRIPKSGRKDTPLNIEILGRDTAVLVCDEGGYFAILMVLALPVIFGFMALTVDVGLWFLDHRMAQNQADAAVLAATQFLPAADTGQATAAVHEWLEKNGSGPGDVACLEYSDLHPAFLPDGQFDMVRVCLERESPGIFSTFSGIPFVTVGATAGARVGPVSVVANIMPWALVPPDTDCNTAGEPCQSDLNGDGAVDPNEHCGYYPPVPVGEDPCPWGMNANRLWVFKSDDPITPGNFAPIRACGNGVPEYIDCIEGELPTGFYKVGETINVAVQPGNLGANTNTALNNRYAIEGADNVWECDIDSYPDTLSGMDPVGKAAAWDKYVNLPFDPVCNFRLVAVPILGHFPVGASEDVEVLGVATFAIAKWDRKAPFGSSESTSTDACDLAANNSGFKCGMVWGYLMESVRPPNVLVGQIGDSENPFAPVAIAMVE